MNNIKQDLDTSYKIVEDLLLKIPATRNSDKRLIYEVICRHSNGAFENIMSFEMFNNIMSFETTRRTRQKIQNEEGRFLSDDAVMMQRAENESHVKDWLFNDDEMQKTKKTYDWRI